MFKEWQAIIKATALFSTMFQKVQGLRLEIYSKKYFVGPRVQRQTNVVLREDFIFFHITAMNTYVQKTEVIYANVPLRDRTYSRRSVDIATYILGVSGFFGNTHRCAIAVS